MSTQALQGVSAPAKYPMVECRVWERFPCGLETTCQPIAARGNEEPFWTAQIRDLSVGGVGVVLNRRFERGAGLAIEIPETTSCPATTLMGRVVHTTSMPGGQWLHGCEFVSLLSDDELQRLLDLGRAQSKPVANELSPHVVPDVILEGLEGDYPRRLIRRFHLHGTWPPKPGTILKVRLGISGDHSYIRLERSVQEGANWVLFYTLCDSSSKEIGNTPGYSTGQKR